MNDKRIELYQYILKHPKGYYNQLEQIAGKRLPRQLELLGYIKYIPKEDGSLYMLTKRGKRVFEAFNKIANLSSKKKSSNRNKVKLTRFEYLILKYF